MKKLLMTLLAAILWLLDFDNILVFILIPAGLIVLGVVNEVGWLWYPIVLGIYAGIIWCISRMIDKAADAGVKAASDWWKKRKK